MQFLISQPDFLRVLTIVEKSLLAKANLPILANVLITASKGEVEILSTNLETATKVTVSVKVGSEGKTTLVGRTLTELVAQLPDEEISFEKLGEEVVVTTRRHKARFATTNPEEFPAIPKISKGSQITLEAADFAEAVGKVVFAAAADEGRPTLTGVLCEFGNDQLAMVATDGYRLSFRQVPLKGAKELKGVKLVIPARALGEVAKITAELGEVGEIVMEVAESLNQVNFKLDNVEFTSRLIEGEFPNWQKVIPSAFATKAKVPREEFVKLVRIAAIFARDGGNIVKLKLESQSGKNLGTVNISATTTQVGSTDAQLPAAIEGKGGEIAFNYRYLLDVLAVIADEEINFEMVESLNPCRITGVGKESFFHIIMPVRLQ